MEFWLSFINTRKYSPVSAELLKLPTPVGKQIGITHPEYWVQTEKRTELNFSFGTKVNLIGIQGELKKISTV